MLGRNEFNRRYLLRLLTSPWTLGPLVLGASIFLAAWAFSMEIGLAIFAALVCAFGGLGVFCTRLLMGSEKVSKAVIEDMQKEAHKKREKNLDNLDSRLARDGDSRTESCLRDLRALAKGFRKVQKSGADVGVHDAFSIASGVEELFSRSVSLLEQTLELHETARSMATEEARKPVLKRRERIVQDVTESISQLGKVLAGVQALRSGENVQSDLARIREDLDQRLAVAKRVEERIRTLEEQIEPSGEVPQV